MSLLADTSGLLVLLDADHALHPQARTLAQAESIIVPSTVLAEVDFMVTRRLGAKTAHAFLEDIIMGSYDFLQVELTDLTRTEEVMRQYEDAEIGLVDASLVALAERYKLRRVLTLDKRHFGMFRPKGLEYLELLP